MRGLNLYTLRKEEREPPGRTKLAPKFRLPPERSPYALTSPGRGLRRRDLVWDSVRHGKERRMYYYCKKARKGMGAYYAVVGTRSWYNKYGLRVLNPDPRPWHETAKRALAPENNMVGRAHPAIFSTVIGMTHESRMGCPQEMPRAYIASESTGRITNVTEREIRGQMHGGMAAGHFSSLVPALLHFAESVARADEAGRRIPATGSDVPANSAIVSGVLRTVPQALAAGLRAISFLLQAAASNGASKPAGNGIAARAAGAAAERTELPSNPQSQPGYPKDNAPQRLQRGMGQSARDVAQEIRGDGATAGPAVDMSGTAADRGPGPLDAVPVPAIAAAKISTSRTGYVAFVRPEGSVQSAQTETSVAASCRMPEMQSLKAAVARPASSVYIPPRIRGKAFRQMVVGAEALPE